MSLLDAFIEDSATNPGQSDRKVVYIAIRNDGATGSGTVDDPYNGSTDELLDNLLSDVNVMAENMTIHFGPGIFETKGYGAQSANAVWFPRSGQWFIGSGIHQTTLRLVEAQAQDSSLNRGWMAPFYSGGTLMMEVEISDMTIDCNLARQPALDIKDQPNLITASAIVLSPASQVSIRRVRVINWGPHTPTIVNGNVGEDLAQECFPIYIDPPYPPPEHPNNVVEDCVWEQPDLCPARESTLVNAKAIPMATVRNCYFNCDMTTGQAQPAISVLKIDYTASDVTLRTKWPHNMQKGDEVLIAGSPVASFNGRFQLDFPLQSQPTTKLKGTMKTIWNCAWLCSGILALSCGIFPARATTLVVGGDANQEGSVTTNFLQQSGAGAIWLRCLGISGCNAKRGSS